VEVVRGGQSGFVGRYPIHAHMLSYVLAGDLMTSSATGAYLGGSKAASIAATHFSVEKCSVRDSAQRAIVIHGTNGALVKDNVCFNIVAHAIFLEEGSERGNTITGNVVLKVRPPTTANQSTTGTSRQIRSFDAAGTYTGPTGLWLTNPDNTVQNNIVADAEIGIWNSFAGGGTAKCFGLSSAIVICPNAIAITSHSGNVGHSNRLHGMMTNFSLTNTAGSLEERKYQPQTDEVGGRADGAAQATGFTITNARLWGNNKGGYRNRVGINTIYEGWAVHNNGKQQLFGAAGGGSAGKKLLAFATTLNTALQGTPPGVSSNIRTGVASYHTDMRFEDCLVWHEYSTTELGALTDPIETGGAILEAGCFETSWDFYLRPGEPGLRRNTGNVWLADTIPMYRSPSRVQLENMSAYYGAASTSAAGITFELATTIPDPDGHMTRTAGGAWIFDDPFFTHNTTLVAEVEPAGANGKVVSETFYAIRTQLADGDLTATDVYSRDYFAHRMNTSYVDQGSFEGRAVGTSNFTGLSRGFAVMKNALYRLEFTTDGPINEGWRAKVESAYSTTDSFIIAVQWDGATSANVQCQTPEPNGPDGTTGTTPRCYPCNSTVLALGKGRNYTSQANLAALVAFTSGTAGQGAYWQDTAGDLVWIKYFGGLVDHAGFDSDPLSDSYQLRPAFLSISPA
jgi:hypothetical protein